MQFASFHPNYVSQSPRRRRQRFAFWLAMGWAGLASAAPIFAQEGGAAVEAKPTSQTPTQETTPPKASVPAIVVPAPQPGDEDFDKAVRLRINVESIDELNEIVKLTESAIEKGLDPSNTVAAKIFLASVYKQRVEINMRQMMQARQSRAAVSKQLGEFLEDLTRSIELDPSLVESYLLKVAILRDRHEYGEAIDVINKGIEVVRPQFEARQNSGELRDKLSKLYIARSTLQEETGLQIADLEKAVEINPLDSNVIKQLLALLESQQVSEGVDNTEKMLKTIDAAMEYAPDNIEYELSKIGVLLRAGKSAEALAYSTERIERATSDENKSALLRQRSLLHQLAGEQELAKQDLDQSIALAKDSVPSMLLRARLSVDMGQVESAKQDIDAILKIDEQNPDAILLRADLAVGSGDYGAAINDYRALIARVPNGTPQREELLMKLSLVFWQSDRHQQALQILDQVIRANSLNWQAHRLQGEIFLSQGEHAEAVTAYEKALGLMPDGVSPDLQASLFNNLAWVLSTSTEDDIRDGVRALELALKACELTNYGQAHILSTLGAAYAETGDFEKALEFAKKGVALGKENKSEQLEQLEGEVKSYEEKKPWREKQDGSSKKKASEGEAPAVEKPAGETSKEPD